MATAATNPIVPQVVQFSNPRRSYTLHCAKPKRVEVMYAGNMMTLPAVDEIHERKADTDADGDPIPGSYVVEDVYTFIPELGDEVLTFDSQKAVVHILGLRKSSDGRVTEASSPFAVSGISLLPRHATKEVWKAALESGEKRAWLTRVQNAVQLIQDVDEKNAKRKAAGMEAVHGGPEWTAARALVAEYNSLVQQDARREIAISPVAADKLDEDVEILAFTRARVMELASKAAEGKAVDKQQLFNELMDDPKIRQWAQKEYRFRRRGHQQIKDDDLEAAAEIGAGVSEAGLEK